MTLNKAILLFTQLTYKLLHNNNKFLVRLKIAHGKYLIYYNSHMFIDEKTTPILSLSFEVTSKHKP